MGYWDHVETLKGKTKCIAILGHSKDSKEAVPHELKHEYPIAYSWDL